MFIETDDRVASPSGATHFYSRIDRLLLRIENRIGRPGAAVVIGLSFLLAAMIYVRPATHPVTMGTLYATLAENPFDWNAGNGLAYRIFTPLISYLLGLRGEGIIITNLLFALALLVAVYLYFRARAPFPADAAVGVAVHTFSLVTLTTVYYGGYTDSATYLVLFLMYVARSGPVSYYLLFLLGLLNRESIAFLVPWFIFLRVWVSGRKVSVFVETAVGIGAALGLYLLFRHWVNMHQSVVYNTNFYLNPLLDSPYSILKKSYSFQGVGLFSLFKILWVIPVLAAVALWKKGRRAEVWSMLLAVVCASLQLIVAWDSSRLFTLAFILMIPALDFMFVTGEYGFRGWVGWLLVGNLFVPQLYTAADKIEVMRSLPGKWIWEILKKVTT